MSAISSIAHSGSLQYAGPPRDEDEEIHSVQHVGGPLKGPRRTPMPLREDVASREETLDDAGAESELRSTPEELALLARLRAGDEAAFVQLIERHHGGLLRLARVFATNHAIAEEVVQESWACVIDGLARFEGRSSLKTWIFRIVTNRAKTRAGREGRSIPFSALGESEPDGEAPHEPGGYRANGNWAEAPRRWEHDTPEKLLLRAEALRRLDAALDDLPPNQRAVVVLRDLEGLEAREVCNVLAMSEANQRVLLHRARCRLRAVLEEYVDTPPTPKTAAGARQQTGREPTASSRRDPSTSAAPSRGPRLETPQPGAKNRC